jgi:hypothetical protein
MVSTSQLHQSQRHEEGDDHRDEVALSYPGRRSGVGKPPVERPEPCAAEYRRREQVNVDPSEPAAIKSARLDERHRFVVTGGRERRKSIEQFEQLRTMVESPARELANHEGMACHLAGVEMPDQLAIAMPEVIDPH